MDSKTKSIFLKRLESLERVLRVRGASDIAKGLTQKQIDYFFSRIDRSILDRVKDRRKMMENVSTDDRKRRVRKIREIQHGVYDKIEEHLRQATLRPGQLRILELYYS